MIKIDDYRYKAEEGKFILRASDNFIMGEDICLGDSDSIENYKEEPYTEENYKAFYDSIGIDIKKPKKEEVKKQRVKTTVETTKERTHKSPL